MRYQTPFGFYELNPLPGCNQLVVSNHAFVEPEHRGTGNGQAAHEERLKRARELGYDYIMCTVRATNAVQIHILEKYEWKHLDTFRNRETGNDVSVYGKQL